MNFDDYDEVAAFKEEFDDKLRRIFLRLVRAKEKGDKQGMDRARKALARYEEQDKVYEKLVEEGCSGFIWI